MSWCLHSTRECKWSGRRRVLLLLPHLSLSLSLFQTCLEPDSAFSLYPLAGSSLSSHRCCSSSGSTRALGQLAAVSLATS